MNMWNGKIQWNNNHCSYFLVIIVFFTLIGHSMGQFYGMDYGIRRGRGNGRCPTNEEVKQDMLLMKQYTNTIRLYSMHECFGAQLVVREAKSLGMNVFLGIQNDPIDVFHWELSIFEDLHKDLGHMDFIVGAGVGSESLFRDDIKNGTVSITETVVKQRIVEFRQFINALNYTFPVGTADVMWSILKHPSVANVTDFFLINIFAYYGGNIFPTIQDTSASDSLVGDIKWFKSQFPGIPVGIGETGWPTSESRSGQNGTTILQWHINQFVCRCWEEDIPLYWFQSFDQPYKEENGVEGTFGIWNDNRTLKIEMTLNCTGYPYTPTPIPDIYVPPFIFPTSTSTSKTSRTTRRTSQGLASTAISQGTGNIGDPHNGSYQTSTSFLFSIFIILVLLT